MLVPSEIGGVPVLVEVLQAPGTEQTSRAESTAERLQDMFARAQRVIEKITMLAAESQERIAARSRRPDQVELEFGLKFTAQGQIVVASAATEASFSMKITYGAPQRGTANGEN
jgi:hypothetical protein